jgi:putative sigma-54 modulation protein
MDIKINTVHFDADKKLLKFVNDKINKLAKFYESIIEAEVFLRLENTQELENKIAEIKIIISGYDFFAKKQSKSFEEATDNAVEAIRQQIIKHKDKTKGA